MPIQITLMSLDFESFEEPSTKTIDKDEIIIGRRTNCDVVLNRPEVSQQHCKLAIHQDGSRLSLLVTDLGSANGTMIERDVITPHKPVAIQTNQRIIVGNYLIKPLHFEASAVAAPAEAERETIDTLPPEEIREPKPEPKAEIKVEAKSEKSVVPELSFAKKLTARGAAVMPFKSRAEAAPTTSAPIAPAAKVEFVEVEAPIRVSAKSKPAVGSPAEDLTVEVSSGDILDLNFDARKLVLVRGRVQHGSLPLSDVEIDAGALGHIRTNSAGEFSFADVPEGEKITLRFKKERFVLEPAEISCSASEEQLPTVEAKALRQISGRVTHHGQPLSGVRIVDGELGERLTNADGVFVFENIVEGSRYSLNALKEKFRFNSIAEAGFINGSDADIAFVATELVTIAGTIRHAGKPLAGVEIEAYEIGKATTDDAGNYRFEDVPEGTKFKLRVSKPGFRFSRSESAQ